MKRHSAEYDAMTGRCRGCQAAIEPWGDAFRHARPRCLAPMRYGERCGRYEGHSRDGHGAGHRTRWAMDNQAIAQNGRAPRMAA